MEKSLTYLATTDASCAELKANVARSEYLAKLAEAIAFKTADGTVEEKKARAKISEESQKAWDRHFTAIAEYEKVRAKRETEVLVVDVWRSMNANRRVGNV
jgi:hypothetical protein